MQEIILWLLEVTETGAPNEFRDIFFPVVRKLLGESVDVDMEFIV